ncbi:hypothetical protein BIW11_12038 [Tropilaelaps mercedesae]|uniref:Uncharacterized protein n=1 Tax=Tropilaelaps mercedesae TaxID=418985 RepID=A0A1V9X905_9ACAR|nr:hypothetical protein BIW11_12038 [Tropilaelaps mercedesae]
MSWSLLAYLPFDPRWVQQIRRSRIKFLQKFDLGGHYRRLVDATYHVWQAFHGSYTLVTIIRSNDFDDMLWPAAVVAKLLFDLALVFKAGADTLNLISAGNRRRKWTLQSLDSTFHRIWIIIVIARFQFYVSLAIYDSEAIYLEFLILLQKVLRLLPHILLHLLVADVYEMTNRHELRTSCRQDHSSHILSPPDRTAESKRQHAVRHSVRKELRS